MSRFVSVDDARRRARRVLPAPVFDYVDGGSDGEVTMVRNRSAFDRWQFRQRVGIDTGAPDLATELLAVPLAAPIVFAPCGLTGVVHPEGERAVARVADRRGTLAAFSTFSNHPLEEIAASASGPKWFQLYFLGGRAGADRLVDRAEAAGYDGLVITLDTAVAGKRERDLLHRVRHPVVLDARTTVRFLPHALRRPRWLARFLAAGASMDFGNLDRGLADADGSLAGALFSAPPTWGDVERLRSRWPGHLIVKGVIEPVDARRAVDLGADAVIVSNHGGRQLDRVPATLEVLPEVVAEVDGVVPVVLDGGVRRGADVATALALGAAAVAIGRPYLYGLGAAGEAGVDAVWNLLVDDLDRTLRLLGCPSVTDLSLDWLRPTG